MKTILVCLAMLWAGSASSAVLFSENFEDNSYASRGWYDNTNQGTIVSSGCYSGNCLQWTWNAGALTPVNGGASRVAITPTDTLYLTFYVKFQSGWQGSQKPYHPHLLHFLSDLDDVWSGLSNTYLTTYVEFLNEGSAIRPMLALQDQRRVNTSNGAVPNNLVNVTENRSVNFCNTPVSTGAAGQCYADVTYYSANTWKSSSYSVSTNAWHKVEVYFKMNSIAGGKGQFDGIMQQWIDGTQVLNFTNVLYRTNQHPNMKWAQFILAAYIGDGSPITQSMWLDQLSIQSTKPNTKVPSPPTGVTVR